MSHERLQMQGMLAGLEQDVTGLTLKIEGLASSMRGGLNTALTPVEELDVPLLANQMRDLETAFVDLQGKRTRIERLKKELGRG